MMRHLRIRFFQAPHPDLAFWICFFALSFLLFLPLYLLNRQTTTFLPVSSLPLDDPAEAIKRLVLWRNNLDPFRLNAEYALMMVLWVNVHRLTAPNTHRFFRWFFIAFYLITFTYYVYEGLMSSLYQVDPVFYSQYQLVVDGLGFVMQHLRVPLGVYLVAGLLLVVGFVIITKLTHTLFDGETLNRLSRRSRVGLNLIALLVFAAILRYQDGLASPKMEISSLAYKLYHNINQSVEAYRNTLVLEDAALQEAYDYSGHNLIKTPNIYLIFVESYGSVLYKRADFRQAYTSLLGQLQRQLDEDGWRSVSALSEAPAWGGGSWMSYTSALFGLRIDTHPEFLSLLEKYQTIDYPDLGRYLKTQGYEYFRLSSLSDELKEEEWLKYKNFYGVDHWLRYRDLDYQGAHYGWGPAPPDQYALNFAQNVMIAGTNKPRFFFFITQNSHYPWVPLPKIVDDWQTLNANTARDPLPPPDPIPHEVRRDNYMQAIKYELEFLTDFILKTGDEGSIFILIGDHQPQRVSRREDGFDTPIHIISKDTAFVDAFLEYGFARGLEVPDLTPKIRHEGFYSMFMRVLLAQYGQGVSVLPDYLPNGIMLEIETSADES